jgi:hypothetical protein
MTSSDYSNLFDDEESDYSNLFDDEESDYSNLFDDEAEMSGLDIASAAAGTFAEGGLGIGDEAGAIGRGIGGTVYDVFNTDKSMSEVIDSNFNWDRNIENTRADMDRLDEEHGAISNVAFGAGLVSSLAVPAATLSKVGRAGKIGLGAAEGAAYGALSGREAEGRMEGAALGGVLGGGLSGLGVLGHKFLTRTEDQIAKIDATEAKRAAKAKSDDSYIWGDEGLGEVKAPLVGKGPSSTKIDKSAHKKERGGMAGTGARAMVLKGTNLWDETKDWLHYGTRGTAERVQDLTGNKRAAMLIKDTESLTQQSDQVIDDFFEELISVKDNLSVEMQEVILDFGRKKKKGKGAPRYDHADLLAKAKTAEERTAAEQYLKVLEEVQATDLKGWRKEGKAYAPSDTKSGVAPLNGKGEKGRLGVNDYENSLIPLKDYAKDIKQARILAQRFGIGDDLLDTLTPKKNQSRTDAIINLIEEQAAVQAGRTTKKGARKATEESTRAAAILADGLRSTLINSKQGGAAFGALVRKWSSTAMLANPSNAVLNLIEGATLPIYQSGAKAWMKTVPDMLWATFNKSKSEADPNWITVKELGQSGQFMGEVAASSKGDISKMTDKLGQFMYKWTGTMRSNDMGTEGVANTALTFARDMVKKGDSKSIIKLRNHDAAAGLSDKEFSALLKDLKDGSSRSEAIDTFAGRAVLSVQPRGAASMPQLYNDIPNGRVVYSMMSYMNRMHNVIRNDIGANLVDAQKYGLNTERGMTAFKEASKNSLKFAALMGVANGVWDDLRKAGFDAEKREDLLHGELRGVDIGLDEEFLGYLMETSSNQLTSLATSGLVNQRAEEYGGSAVGLSAPPIAMTEGLLTAGYDVLTEQDPSKLLRWGQSYFPGVAQADKARKTVTGDRLFQELAYD